MTYRDERRTRDVIRLLRALGLTLLILAGYIGGLTATGVLQ